MRTIKNMKRKGKECRKKNKRIRKEKRRKNYSHDPIIASLHAHAKSKENKNNVYISNNKKENRRRMKESK